MKAFKISIAIASVLIMLMPFINLSAAYADASGQLECDSEVTCDLGIDKTISVNNGPSIQAPTAAQAVLAKVGDTLTWTITVSGQPQTFPFGRVTVNDTLPSGLQLVSATPSVGTFSNGNWTFDIDWETLPYTLVLVTTATGTGLIENTASISEYALPSDDGNGAQFQNSYPYSDADPSNNTANAFVNIPVAVVQPIAKIAAPAVKVPNTGFEPAFSNPWIDVLWGLMSGGAVFGLAYKLRRTVRS